VVFDPENLEASSITGTVSIASVDTNNDGRDEHLQEDDYFDTQQFPVASFESTSWTQEDDDEYIVTGHLTILDTTREIEMELEFLGMGPGRRPGSVVTGWEGEFEIDRRDYGITSGQGVIGNEVEIELNIQAHLVTEE